jgi:hypothetical protein
MMSSLIRRVDRLEAEKAGPRKRVIIYREMDETSDQAISRHLAEHLEDANSDFIVIVFLE